MRSRFGSRQVIEPVLGAVFFGSVGDLHRDADTRGRDQQAKCEAVYVLADHFFVVVAKALFDLSPGAVAGAEGVLGFLASLADQSGVDQE